MDLIEDLRLNHTYCPKEVILAAADEIERLQEALLHIECEPINAEYMARAALDAVPNVKCPS